MELAKYFSKDNFNRIYIEKTFKGTQEEYIQGIKDSKTVYVSNINDNIKEERLWILFSIVGPVKRIIMGVNKGSLTFCGFCFVEYESKESADISVNFFKDFLLDGKLIKIDKDIGFTEGRQYGRGAFGGSMKNDERKRRR